jgi:uncharacterized protein YxjI
MVYRMRQAQFTFGEDFYIENEHGQPVFLVDGKAARIRQRLSFQDLYANELAYIRGKLVSIRGAYHVYRDKAIAVRIKRRLYSPTHESYSIHLVGGESYVASGDVFGYEYALWAHGQKVVLVSKRLFSEGKYYAVNILGEVDDVLLLASTAILDLLAHPAER